MITILKKELANIIKDVLIKLEKASVLWFEFYEKNPNKPYEMESFGGLDDVQDLEDILEIGQPIKKWACDTTCCRLGDLPRVFPIKEEHFKSDEHEFSYCLFAEDLFSTAFIQTHRALVVVSDLEVDKVQLLKNFIHSAYKTNSMRFEENILTAHAYKDVLYFEFLWDLLFHTELDGSKEELLTNYPIAVSILKKILEIIES